jgi:hypothetical protein
MSDGEVTDNRFGRFTLDAEQKFKWMVVGVQNIFEDNRFFANNTDSLGITSYAWNDAKVYLRSPDGWKNSYSVFYQRRTTNCRVWAKWPTAAWARASASAACWARTRTAS